jgi:hypothetical protein
MRILFLLLLLLLFSFILSLCIYFILFYIVVIVSFSSLCVFFVFFFVCFLNFGFYIVHCFLYLWLMFYFCVGSVLVVASTFSNPLQIYVTAQ